MENEFNMNNLKSITIYIILFIVLTLGITFVIILKNNQQKELNCATPEPIQFCGTSANSSEGAIKGKHLFNSNCAACHSLDKNFTGPALRNIDSLQFINWLSQKNEKLDTTKMSEFKIDYHKITWNNKLSIMEINQLIEYCKN